METEKAPNIQKNLEKEETILRKRTELEESCSLNSDYTTKIQQSAVIKTVQYWHKKDAQINETGIDSPEINSCASYQLTYNKGGKNV